MVKNENISQEMLLASMRQNTAELWTKEDVEATFKCGIRPADNALYNLYRKGLIYRHKNNDPDSGFARYAVSIKEENRVVWTKNEAYSNRSKGSKGSKRKEVVTAKELRMMISQIIRSLSSLEDALCPALEQLEERQKQLDKIKNLI